MNTTWTPNSDTCVICGERTAHYTQRLQTPNRWVLFNCGCSANWWLQVCGRCAADRWRSMVKSFGSGDWDNPRLGTPDAISLEGHSLAGHQNWKNRLVNMMIAKLSSRHELHKMDPPIKLTPEMFEIKGPVRIHHTYSGAAYPPHAQTVGEMELEYIRSMDEDLDMDLL